MDIYVIKGYINKKFQQDVIRMRLCGAGDGSLIVIDNASLANMVRLLSSCSQVNFNKNIRQLCRNLHRKHADKQSEQTPVALFEESYQPEDQSVGIERCF